MKSRICCGHLVFVKGDNHGDCPLCRNCSEGAPCVICIHWTPKSGIHSELHLTRSRTIVPSWWPGFQTLLACELEPKTSQRVCLLTHSQTKSVSLHGKTITLLCYIPMCLPQPWSTADYPWNWLDGVTSYQSRTGGVARIATMLPRSEIESTQERSPFLTRYGIKPCGAETIHTEHEFVAMLVESSCSHRFGFTCARLSNLSTYWAVKCVGIWETFLKWCIRDGKWSWDHSIWEPLAQVHSILGTTLCPIPPPHMALLHPAVVWDLEPSEKECTSLPQLPSITRIMESLSSYLQAGDP